MTKITTDTHSLTVLLLVTKIQKEHPYKLHKEHTPFHGTVTETLTKIIFCEQKIDVHIRVCYITLLAINTSTHSFIDIILSFHSILLMNICTAEERNLL